MPGSQTQPDTGNQDMHTGDLEYVGFWARVGATLIDTLLVMAVTFPLLLTIYGWEYFALAQGGWFAGPAELLIRWALPAVAVVLFWLYRDATPGKMAISARVVDAETGHSMSLGQSVGRYLAYFVSILPLCLGLLWVAFDSRKQGWHDKLAGTVVIRPAQRGRQPVRFDGAREKDHGLMPK